jgi:glycyl-tRNA synthetase
MSSSLSEVTLKDIASLAKRRGFIFPGSEVYGGFANTYSYGPYGAQLKKTIKDLWWKRFVESSDDIVGLDGPILLHPMTWKASGHVDGFSDALVDCKACKARHRVDHMLEAALGIDVEGFSLEKMDELIAQNHLKCPKCGKSDFTPSRKFNLMFQTQMSKTETGDHAYLRPETAQAIFLDFKNVCDSLRVRVPFGIAQIGKAFRNEITPGNFIFRTIEFEQMEIEYFIKEEEWQTRFDSWINRMLAWCELIGLSRDNLVLHEHAAEKLSHYSKRTVDIQFRFPFGTSELYGLAYRTDFDLKQHMQCSGKSLEYTDPADQKRWIPHVIEPTFGLDRSLLAILCQAYAVENLEGGDQRTVLRFKPYMAPVHVAVFPLMKKEPLQEKAIALYKMLKSSGLRVDYDDSAAIGKRYRRQDEIGTPYCVTVDFDSLENNDVTLRDRDSMKQERLPISALIERLKNLTHVPM